MLEILSILRRVVDNAVSLILDVTNNVCEQFNSIINKFIAGKRINFSLKQSYNTRVQAAIISYNTNGNFLNALHKNIMEKSPGKRMNICQYYYYLLVVTKAYNLYIYIIY